MAVEAVIFQQIVDVNWDQAIYTASPNNTINVAQFAAKGSGTNIGIALTPKGTGHVAAHVPNSAASGGNARGWYAVDWQLIRAAANEVASGFYATIGGGHSNRNGANWGTIGGGSANICTGDYGTVAGGRTNNAGGADSTVPGGIENSATGEKSTAYGYRATATRYGQVSHSSGIFAAQGDCKSITHEMRCKTTTNSAVEMFLDGASIRLILVSNTIINAIVEITGLRSDGSASASYHRQVEIKRIGNTTTLVKSEVVGVDNASGTSIAITADDTNESLKITATGITSETWRWMATIRGSEMGMGA